MIGRPICALLFACAPALAVAADAGSSTVAQVRSVLARPLAQIERAQTLRGRFVQSKQIEGFPQPLVSSGDFLFVRALGVAWRTLEPIQSELLLDPNGARGLDGSKTRADARAHPEMRTLSAIFLALFALDLEALAAQFELSAKPCGAGWELLLVPRDPAMAATAPALTLSGGDRIEHIEFTDARGDATRIMLEAQQASVEPATAAERARFAP